MISIDQIAYRSKLRRIDPLFKLVVITTVIFADLFANSFLVSGITILVVYLGAVSYGGTRFQTFLKLMLLPLSFLVLGLVTITIQRSDTVREFIVYIRLFDSYYGIDRTAVWFAFRLALKSIAAISCMYFLALTTPMIEFFSALRRLRLPKLFVELMEMIYRFIFVLTETANKIYVAQSSRLGYSGLRAGYQSLGILVSMLFVRAYKNSDRVYIALESRGYTGELNVIDMEYEIGARHYIFSVLLIVALVLAAIFESTVMK